MKQPQIYTTPESNDPFEVSVDGITYKIKPVLYDAGELTRLPLICVPIDMPLPCPLYVKLSDKFVMFRHKNDHISDKRLSAFIDHGIDAVYILKPFWNSLVSALESYVLPLNSPIDEKLRHIRSLLMAYTGEIDQHVESPTKLTFSKLEALSGQLATEIEQDPMAALKLIRRNADPTIYFVNHAVNSGIYAALIGKTLSYPTSDLQQLIYAGLVHDIGNIYVPKNILYKKGKLNQNEIEIIKMHTQNGAELLKSIGADSRVVTAAHHHHERVDGHGYPKGLPGKKIHPFSKIIAIADVFDAITCNRPHQKGLSSSEAMNKMRSEEGLFDLSYLNKISFGQPENV